MPGDAVYLADIVDAGARIGIYIAGHTLDLFQLDVMRQDAILYRLAVIGEATRRLSHKAKSSRPDVPWRRIVAMRNVLVHDYAGTDLWVVFQTATVDVPELMAAVREMQQQLPPAGVEPGSGGSPPIPAPP